MSKLKFLENKRGGRNKGCCSRNIMFTFFAIVVIIIFIFLFLNGRIDKSQDNQIALEQKMPDDSFYKKLTDGIDVNILIVGDSIGEGAGKGTDSESWFTLLQSYLKVTYNSNVSLTNVSMGGNTSYAGYVRTMALDDDVDYDLAIICYGQNDNEKSFSKYYEAIIRAIERKYSNCSIISILESSQREYTNKITMIQNICKHYEIPMADTIAAFNNSGMAYDELTNDGVHPNDAGQKIYFTTVKDVIDENISALIGNIDIEVVCAINEDMDKFDNFRWFGINEAGFQRVDDTTFMLNTSVSGIMGIDYTFVSGENKADIYVDGELYESPTVTFNYDFLQRHIIVVNEECIVNNEIKVVFSTKEQADGFYGMCFSWN